MSWEGRKGAGSSEPVQEGWAPGSFRLELARLSRQKPRQPRQCPGLQTLQAWPHTSQTLGALGLQTPTPPSVSWGLCRHRDRSSVPTLVCLPVIRMKRVLRECSGSILCQKQGPSSFQDSDFLAVSLGTLDPAQGCLRGIEGAGPQASSALQQPRSLTREALLPFLGFQKDFVLERLSPPARSDAGTEPTPEAVLGEERQALEAREAVPAQRSGGKSRQAPLAGNIGPKGECEKT